jgi:hypothetical protein
MLRPSRHLIPIREHASSKRMSAAWQGNRASSANLTETGGPVKRGKE